MQLLKNKIQLLKELASRLAVRFKRPSEGGDLMSMVNKPKRSIEYSNLIRRLLLLIFTGQWVWMMWVSERMYIKNGDIGDNWTRLLIAIVGMMSVILGFYFSGNYSDRDSEEFKKIREYDNDRFAEYHEEIKEEGKDNSDTEHTPKAILEEDEDNE